MSRFAQLSDGDVVAEKTKITNYMDEIVASYPTLDWGFILRYFDDVRDLNFEMERRNLV